MSEQPKEVIDILTAYVSPSDSPFRETEHDEIAVSAIWYLQDSYRWQKKFAAPMEDEAWLRLLDRDVNKVCRAIKRWAKWVHEQAQTP